MSLQRHRHFVALPLTLFVFVLLGVSSVSLRASSTNEHTEEYRTFDASHVYSLGTGASLSLESHTSVHIDTLDQSITPVSGSFFLTSGPLRTVHLPCSQLSLLHATAYVSLTSESVTIFALRGSAYIVPCDADPVYLSEGQQFRRTFSSGDMTIGRVPRSWALEHTSSIALPPALPSAFSFADVPNAIRSYAFLKMLSMVPPPSDVIDISPDVLRSFHGGHSSFLMALLQETAAERLQLSDVILDWWRQSLLALASSQPETAFALLREAAFLPSIFSRSDYPLQQERWQTLLLSTLATIRPFLSPKEQSSLPELQQAILLLPTQQASSFSSSVSSATLSPDDLLLRTRFFLEDAHFAFMATTSLSVDPFSQRVHVSSVVRSEHSLDHLYDFEVDPVAERLFSVVQDGVLLPNDLPFSFFLSKKDHSEE